MLNVRLASDYLYGELAVYLTVACDVFIGVSVLSFFPRDVLDGIWDLIGSVSEGFPTSF